MLNLTVAIVLTFAVLGLTLALLAAMVWAMMIVESVASTVWRRIQIARSEKYDGDVRE